MKIKELVQEMTQEWEQNLRVRYGIVAILVILGFIIWIGWHVLAARQESEKLSQLARRRPGANDWKNNVTDG